MEIKEREGKEGVRVRKREGKLRDRQTRKEIE